MSRASQILEGEVGSTLVIHLDDRSTDFLKPIYEGMGYPVITGSISRSALLQAIEEHSRIFMLGHGGPSGLFGRNYSIDDQFGEALSRKPSGLYVWCNADAYAKRNKLSGLVTGMFISEVLEARMFGIQATQEEVDFSNNAFAKVVRAHLDNRTPPASVRQCYTHATCKITKFNNERIYVFEKGVPTPELHPTSMARPSERYRAPDDELGDERAASEEWKEWRTWQDWWDDVADLAAERGLDMDAVQARYSDLEAHQDAGLTPEEAVDRLDMEPDQSLDRSFT